MAKITYAPPDNDDFPRSTEQFGLWFDAGREIEVSDTLLIEKFRGNRFFKVAAEEQPQPPPRTEELAISPEKRGRGRPPKAETNDGS